MKLHERNLRTDCSTTSNNQTIGELAIKIKPDILQVVFNVIDLYCALQKKSKK